MEEKRMKITLKDGSVKEYTESKSVIDIAFDISEGLARAACAGQVDGQIVDLRTVIHKDCSLNILTARDPEGLRVVRHTCSHVLAEAVRHLFPNAKLAIGPAIDTGFYYDFEAEPFSREDLDQLEKEMKRIIKKGNKLERFTLPREEAIRLMTEKEEPYKVELITDLPADAEISFYSQGDFVDLCAGPHLMNTKGIKAFKLTSSSGAYWRGDSSKPMLQRIYGSAFSTKDELNEYLQHLEEIKKRDHNKLGREMELFTTVDVIGQGLPLLMPKGAKIIQTLQRWIEDEEDNNWGYIRTKTPLMAKSDLYKISGHWDHYKDGMFVLGDEETDKEVFALRPMTCPFQYYVYKSRQRSYRDLPLRYSETSTLFRNEDSGEMHGLTPVSYTHLNSPGHQNQSAVYRPSFQFHIQCQRQQHGCHKLYNKIHQCPFYCISDRLQKNLVGKYILIIFQSCKGIEDTVLWTNQIVIDKTKINTAEQRIDREGQDCRDRRCQKQISRPVFLQFQSRPFLFSSHNPTSGRAALPGCAGETITRFLVYL